MQIGIAMFVTDYSIHPGELGAAIEERGFHSMWMPEHTHIPTSRKSPWGGGPELPQHYKDTLDPFLALTAAAMTTKRIKLATGICLIVERDPIHTAKEVATLDYLSGGRVILGVGGGWNAEEMGNHGTAFDTRFALMRERIEAIKAIWTQDVTEYRGTFVDIEPMWCNPKPVQKPHPPILVGGAFPYGARRAIAYGNGWLPHASRPTYGDITTKLPEFREMAKAAGRDPASIPVTVYGAPEDLDRLKHYRDEGIARAIFEVPSAGADEVLPILDRCAALVRRCA